MSATHGPYELHLSADGELLSRDAVRVAPQCVAGCLDSRSDYYYVIGQDIEPFESGVPASFACTR